MISMEFLVATGVGWVTACGIYLLLRGRSFTVVLGLRLRMSSRLRVCLSQGSRGRLQFSVQYRERGGVLLLLRLGFADPRLGRRDLAKRRYDRLENAESSVRFLDPLTLLRSLVGIVKLAVEC